MMKDTLVNISEHGLMGKSFYWYRYADYGFTLEELKNTGVVDDAVWVSAEILPALLEVDTELRKQGRRLYLKEGYRSPELYELIYKSRVAKFGQEMTDKLLNMQEMPHATGRSVDVAIWDIEADKEIYLRKNGDGPESLLIDFYKEANDEEGKRCYELQNFLIDLMLKHGFGLGKRREYFHFDYRG